MFYTVSTVDVLTLDWALVSKIIVSQQQESHGNMSVWRALGDKSYDGLRTRLDADNETKNTFIGSKNTPHFSSHIFLQFQRLNFDVVVDMRWYELKTYVQKMTN